MQTEESAVLQVMNEVRQEFATLAAREPVSLPRGALLIAKEEYPGLDVDKYIDRLGRLSELAEPIISSGLDTVERVQLLSQFMFEDQGFAGNHRDFSDPRNSFLNEVIERRLGIPISLSVVYIEVGRRLGLNLYGVSFPGHFLVKAVDERGELIIDPFNGGEILDLEAIRSRLQETYGADAQLHSDMLKAAGARQILSRMLRNLKNIYVDNSDWSRALGALDRILMLEPRSLDDMVERGGLYERLECFQAALSDLQTFLSMAPDHPAADVVRDGVVRLMREVAKIN